MFDIGTLIIVSIIVLFASFLQAGTGFGFSIMATPLLLLIYSPQAAIQINIILSIVLSFIMIPKIYREVDKKLLIRLLIGSIAGVPAGVAIFMYMNIKSLELLIGVIILLVTLMLTFRIQIKPTKIRDGWAGWVSGMLTTSVGIPGPPLLIYFSGAGVEKAKLRGTTLIYFIFVYTISLIMQIMVAGNPGSDIWIISAILVPVVIMGMVLGQFLFQWLSQAMFQRLTYVLLFLTGGYLLASNLI